MLFQAQIIIKAKPYNELNTVQGTHYVSGTRLLDMLFHSIRQTVCANYMPWRKLALGGDTTNFISFQEISGQRSRIRYTHWGLSDF